MNFSLTEKLPVYKAFPYVSHSIPIPFTSYRTWSDTEKKKLTLVQPYYLNYKYYSNVTRFFPRVSSFRYGIGPRIHSVRDTWRWCFSRVSSRLWKFRGPSWCSMTLTVLKGTDQLFNRMCISSGLPSVASWRGWDDAFGARKPRRAVLCAQGPHQGVRAAACLPAVTFTLITWIIWLLGFSTVTLLFLNPL